VGFDELAILDLIAPIRLRERNEFAGRILENRIFPLTALAARAYAPRHSARVMFIHFLVVDPGFEATGAREVPRAGRWTTVSSEDKTTWVTQKGRWQPPFS
jgi:hypothetical protein